MAGLWKRRWYRVSDAAGRDMKWITDLSHLILRLLHSGLYRIGRSKVCGGGCFVSTVRWGRGTRDMRRARSARQPWSTAWGKKGAAPVQLSAWRRRFFLGGSCCSPSPSESSGTGREPGGGGEE